MNITLAQINLTVGDFKANRDKILQVINDNSEQSDLIIFPELCVCGYPPEDLVLRDEFITESIKHTQEIITQTKKLPVDILISTPWKESDGKIYNCSLIAGGGKIIHKQYKYDLPNYGVFDEKRVFSKGSKPKPFNYKGKKIGLLICEDTWNKENASELLGAEFILSINASPFEVNKYKTRRKITADIAEKCNAPVIYLNQICGHDDLVFDGGSFTISRYGKLTHQLKYFSEDVTTISLHDITNEMTAARKSILLEDSYENISTNEHIYKAMVLGLQEYVNKSGFPGVIIGLSGGVDSALSAVVAVDALGRDRVRLVMMPSKFTSQDSLDDAKLLADNLGVELENISIEPIVAAFEQELQPSFAGKERDLTEENIQSRIRGDLLMALSNKFGHMVLTTGNKSEVAVGYSTLYGDMCGGYNVLKDIYKTRVFELCNWRNKNGWDLDVSSENVMPQNIITKPPSAELREDQKDEDSLPPYEIMDKILHLIIEEDLSSEDIAKQGFNINTIHEIEKLVHRSEYKRRQSAPGVKIGKRPFGRDRRYPIVNKFM